MNKLYRSNDSKLFGVCGGIGEYLGIDPTVVRMLWIISLFFTTGVSAIIYLVLAFVVPPADNY